MRMISIFFSLVVFVLTASSKTTRDCNAFYRPLTNEAKDSQSELDWGSVLPTKSVAKLAEKELLKAIRIAEKNGMHGGWYKSVSPFADDGKADYFYVVKSVPNTFMPDSPIYLFREDHSLQFLNQRLDLGVLVVFGNIPQQAGALAAALGGTQLDMDIITKLKSRRKNIVLLQPSADKYVVAHEVRHWQDFEDANFELTFKQDMKEFLEAKYLDDDDKSWLWRITWEIRGHSTQEIQIRTDEKAHLPILNRIGNVVTGSKQRRYAYAFEAAEAASSFSQAYPPILWKIAEKVKKQGRSAFMRFVKSLEKYDLHENPNTTLSFRKILVHQ